MKTLVVGHVTADVVDHGVIPGGCALYAARAHRAMQSEVHLYTAYRNQDLPTLALDDLAVKKQATSKTTCFVNTYQQDGRVQFIKALAPALLPPRERHWDVLHLAPVMGEVNLGAWVDAQPARVIALGLQGWLRAPERLPGPVGPRPIEFAPSLLSRVDLACCSEEDLRGHQGLLPLLCRYIPLVVVTFGARGCVVWDRGVPRGFGVYDVKEVDPTGAGDTFAAAMSQGIARGWTVEASAKMAAALSSRTVECPGVPSVSDLDHARYRSAHIQAA